MRMTVLDESQISPWFIFHILSSRVLHMVSRHLPQLLPRLVQAQTSHPLPDDAPLPIFGLTVDVPIRIFYNRKCTPWWRTVSLRPTRISSYAWGWITISISMPSSIPTSSWAIDHLFLPAMLSPAFSYLRILLLPVRGPVILPAASTSSSSPYSYSTPEAKEALGRDEGHKSTGRPGYARSETDGPMKFGRRCREARERPSTGGRRRHLPYYLPFHSWKR
jgi:hypothetical protein